MKLDTAYAQINQLEKVIFIFIDHKEKHELVIKHANNAQRVLELMDAAAISTTQMTLLTKEKEVLADQVKLLAVKATDALELIREKDNVIQVDFLFIRIRFLKMN